MPKPIRRSQAISPFGVGAMVDFPGPSSLVHAGLDAWPFDETNHDHREFMIEDEHRLSERLGVDFFVLPPDYRYQRTNQASDEVNLNLKLPFLRFPRWHVCPRCGLMYESELHDKEAPSCIGPVASGKGKGKSHPKRKTVQVRFISACQHGHLQDFPWWEWVFQKSDPDSFGLRLRMVSSGSASLAGVRIVCEKDVDSIQRVESRSLAGAFGGQTGEESALSRIGVLCSGHNPALAVPSSNYPAKGCGNHLQPLLRGGSNVYFPHVVSSIYLPTIDLNSNEEALEILDNPYVWQYVEMMSDANGDNQILPQHAQSILKKYYPSADVSVDELTDAANRKLSGESSSQIARNESDSEEQHYRREEYTLLRNDINEGYPKTNLLIKSSEIQSYGTQISKYFNRISLIHKLRETRAFTGFSRIFPESGLSNEEKRKLISHTHTNWLPAIIVRGEGIFLEIKEERIRDWAQEYDTQLSLRIDRMQKMFNQLRIERHQEERVISPRFVLLHTLAHMLINQLVYDCGYGSASLRERIYCSDGDSPMAGILIYTASGDSEGTMGGLVRMGMPGRLENVLSHALENAQWCSSDPVCIESGGQGPDNCNLAACHSCSLLPETSCEEGNRLLDRGMLIGTLTEREIAFFEHPV